MMLRGRKARHDVARSVLEAVAHRHGHRCAVCGRRCGAEDTWRHTHAMPGQNEDDPSNFSLLCGLHRELAFKSGARPARYLFAFPTGNRALIMLGAAWRWIVLTLGAFAYAGFTAAVLFGVWRGTTGEQPLSAIRWLVVVILLFMIAGWVMLVVRGRAHEIGAKKLMVYHERVN